MFIFNLSCVDCKRDLYDQDSADYDAQEISVEQFTRGKLDLEYGPYKTHTRLDKVSKIYYCDSQKDHKAIS